MIISLSARNVRRHRDIRFPLSSSKVRIAGPNGIGKSTLGDILAFAFTGRDKNGAPAPIHLITDGEDKMEVSVETAKAVIYRTLTRKKTSTLKLTPKASMIPVVLSQTEFSAKMGCTPEVFLSATFAGYFFTLDTEKRMEVLRAAAPPVDRGQILRQILAEICPEVDFAPYEAYLSPVKRSDIEKARVADSRRSIEREIDGLRGRHAEIHATSTANLAERPTVDASRYQEAEARYEIWNNYRKDLEAWEAATKSAAAMEDALRQWERKHDLLDEQMKLIPCEKQDNQDEVLRLGQEVADLKGKLSPLPARPATLTLPDVDRCMTCGQVIGSKHREKVAAELDEAIKAHQAACNAVEEENRRIQEEVVEAQKRYVAAKEERARISEHNKKVRAQLEKAQQEMKVHLKVRPHTHAIPSKPSTPIVEETSFEEYKRAYDAYAQARQNLVHWEEARDAAEQASRKINEIAERMIALDNTHKALSWIEAAYSRLDQRVFDASASFYDLGDGFRIHAEDKVVTVLAPDGKPYEWMSTGEQVRTSIRLCEKIGMSLKPRTPFLFVDNADLMDHRPLCAVPQVFFVYVKDQDGLFVEGGPINGGEA